MRKKCIKKKIKFMKKLQKQVEKGTMTVNDYMKEVNSYGDFDQK